MKKSILCLMVAATVFFPAVLSAEGGGNQDWAEKAALQYEEKAAKAQAAGNAEDAAIYTKMAQIKRDAGAAAKAGTPFSWDEYHALNGQLTGAGKNPGDKGKTAKEAKGKNPHAKKKDHDPSKYSKPEDKEKTHDKKPQPPKKDKEDPAAGFISTAQQYQKESIEAMKTGDTEKAKIYMDLAQMKLDAAAAVGKGTSYDWTKYHELRKRLENNAKPNSHAE